MKGVIEYNERKVDDGTAEVEWSRDLDASTRLTVERSFREIEKKKYRSDCKNISLHISINPTPEDAMDGEKVRGFAEELLQKLGYGSQPYILYRHTDIDRVHWHLVSIRLNPEGRKIKESFEREKTQKVLFQLAEKYGYTPNKDGEMKTRKKESAKEKKSGKTIKEKRSEDTKQAVSDVQHEDTAPSPAATQDDYDEDYIPGAGIWVEEDTTSVGSAREITDDEEKIFEEGAPVKESMRDAIESSLAYHFTTLSQFMLILQAHGVEMKKNDKTSYDKEGMTGITLQGLSPEGEPCTSPVPFEELPGGDFLWESLLHRMETCKKDGKSFMETRQKLAKEIRSAVRNSGSEEEFRDTLSQKGIQIDFFKTAEGKIYGVSIIDHREKAAFKASDLSRDLSARYFQSLWDGEKTEKAGKGLSEETKKEKRGKSASGKESGTIEEIVTEKVFSAMRSLLNAGVAVSSRRSTRAKGDRETNIKYTPTNAGRTTRRTAGGELVRV